MTGTNKNLNKSLSKEIKTKRKQDELFSEMKTHSGRWGELAGTKQIREKNIKMILFSSNRG